MQRDNIALQDFIECNQFRRRLFDEWIERNPWYLKLVQQLRQTASGVAETDNSYAPRLPLIDIAEGFEQCSNNIFGNRLRVATWCMRKADSRPRQIIEIDMIGAD